MAWKNIAGPLGLNMDVASILDQTACGAIAAAGFGVLFNFGFRGLPWCAASGALALAVRSSCLGMGWSLEGASFAAALTVGVGVQVLRTRAGISQEVLDAVGCIPMIPGSFAAKAIIGLFALATSAVVNESETLITAAQYTLRVIFTIGAIGTGLVIPTLLLRLRAAH
jgi:uncharacterized membrane protein YjjB (DUF3815 family)